MKWLSSKDEKKLGFVYDKDKEPSSPKVDEVRVEPEDVLAVETLAKAPDNEDEPATVEPVPYKDDPNTKVEPKLQRSKRRRSSPLTSTDKPKARKKSKMTKKGPVELSDESQEAKREEETVLAEDTSQAPKTDDIENVKRSMVFGV
ncbi:hypothetical protein R1flu_005426 [Riccia fluitans]|uniref:Uncharacterized protein n=1 Tax=Riccia fluitans TaxID=41844 RepID=A0ABD1YT62_9MARC